MLHDESSYLLAKPTVSYDSDQDFGFGPGEGGTNVILEAKIAGTFNLLHSDWRLSNAPRDFQWRVAIAGNVNLRLIKDPAFTSPSLPPSNKVGLRADFGLSQQLATRVLMHFIRADIFHYSNGQADEGFDPDLGRANLRFADFSTNYIRVSYGLSLPQSIPVSGSHGPSRYTLNVYLQRDGRDPGSIGNVLDFLPDDGNYGQWRFGGRFVIPDYFRGFSFTRPPQFSYRVDYAFILDRLTNSRIPRFEFTGKLVWHPYQAPCGLLLFAHLGRDHMNIRYTIPGLMAMTGIGVFLEFR